ncbi:MAG: hypothetical protein M0C28_12945 [Candidatus Moduliflexus flocculans]|nr:hypothetical protein [Candidatus Moduliflexus flocculans]
MTAFEFARRHLFEPLGITDVVWPLDPRGVDNHGWGDLQLRPHDMAKIGALVLNRGVWQGRRILSAAMGRRGDASSRRSRQRRGLRLPLVDARAAGRAHRGPRPGRSADHRLARKENDPGLHRRRLRARPPRPLSRRGDQVRPAARPGPGRRRASQGRHPARSGARTRRGRRRRGRPRNGGPDLREALRPGAQRSRSPGIRPDLQGPRGGRPDPRPGVRLL